jgi:D-alanyl-D-alanine carboxypeptidase/D-alanyl-D-alanine-endopeptidase (penicillin-binding protein 4)
MKRRTRSPVAITLALVALALAVPACQPDLRNEGVDVRGPAHRQLIADLNALFDDPRYDDAFWGVRAETLDGRVLYSRNAARNFIPASNMKLFTSACALDMLGPDYTYETRVIAVGTLRTDGTLDGDLVIVGSGDPTLGAWHPEGYCDSRCLLPQWSDAVRAAGIRRVTGRVVGDGRCFTDDYYSPDWNYGDLNFWYATGSSGLAIEENAYRVKITPGPDVGTPASLAITPPTDYITVINQTRTVEPGGKNTADSTWQQVEGNHVRFVGTIAADKDVIDERGSVYDGARYAAYLFREQLECDGVDVTGPAANIRSLSAAEIAAIDDAPADARDRIATYKSPPLREIVAVINRPSHNFFADQVVRTLGRVEAGEGSFAAGTRVVAAWLERIGAPQPDAFRMYDGSGLARRSLVQPRQITHLLRYMHQKENLRDAFLASLPVGGEHGTLAKRLTDPATKGNVHAKTGYIGHVRALSGYLTDASGRLLVFSMICNQYTTPTADVNATQDAACVLLATFRE